MQFVCNLIGVSDKEASPFFISFLSGSIKIPSKVDRIILNYFDCQCFAWHDSPIYKCRGG